LAIWIELENEPLKRLRHGQSARVTLTVATGSPTLAVPLSAVVWEGTQAYVFVEEPRGTFERRSVRTGAADDRWVVIQEGIEAGERVAVRGALELRTARASLK